MTRNIRCVFRDKKANGIRDIGWSTQPRKRDLFLKSFLDVGRQPLRHRRINESGRYSIHGHIPAGVFPRNRLRKPDDRRLRSGIVGLADIPHRPDNGGNVDYPTIALFGHGVESNFHSSDILTRGAGNPRINLALAVV